jgi:LmbE family N-acetylglucosaminyl deacetylase
MTRFLICEKDIPIVVPKKILIIAPHPDDEIISCGGTILKYQEFGSEIVIIVATPGIGGYAQASQKENVLERRHEELSKVEKILDCTIIELNYEDLAVTREKVATMTNLIREQQPQVILMPHFSDFHRVHRHLSYICREAIYHCATGKAYGGHERNWIPFGVYYYESPSCKFQYVEGNVFLIVDISNYWNQKEEIFNHVYSSQKEVLERVIEWARDTATLRGYEINGLYGEAFIPETTYTPMKLLLV